MRLGFTSVSCACRCEAAFEVHRAFRSYELTSVGRKVAPASGQGCSRRGHPPAGVAAMSRDGTGRGRSAQPVSLPPQLHFDRLMTAVGQAAQSSSKHVESPRSGPASGWEAGQGEQNRMRRKACAARKKSYHSLQQKGMCSPQKIAH